MARAEHHRHVLAGTALERLAGQRALERYGDAIALFCPLALGGERPVLVGDGRQRLIDLGIVDRRRLPFDLYGLEIGQRDRRHDLHLDRVGEIRLALDDTLDSAFVRRQHDLRLGGELKSAVADDLVVGLAHRSFDHLGHGRFAVEALEMRDRNFTGPEAPQLHAALKVVETLLDLCLKSVAGTTTRYSRLRPAAAVSVTCIGTTLHGSIFTAQGHEHRAYPGQVLEKPPGWCGRRGSNPHDFRHGNLNPARLPIPPRPRRAGRPGGAAYITQGARHTTKIAPVRRPARDFTPSSAR